MERTKEPNQILRALMDTVDTISIYFKYPIEHAEAGKISFFNNKKIADFKIKHIHDTRLIITVEPMDIKGLHFIAYEKNKIHIIPHGVLDTRTYNYTGRDLGLTYSNAESIFKVFAPTATAINLNIYDDLAGNGKATYNLTEGCHGVWSAAVIGDLSGKYYAFNVYGALPEFKGDADVIDPYAKCAICKSNKAMIIDEKKYSQKNTLNKIFHPSSSVIYEVNVRDISSDKSCGTNYNGKYKALTEHETYLNGDKNTGITTLISHIKELGVNTVQFMPLQDFDNDESNPDFYAWGYMPRFFNTPDGIYASDWKTDSKIKELKDMINCFHKNNLRVILDVVYNHTAEGFYGDGVYSFNAFVPYYYYRFGNGYISNGSGCGNELRSEGYMVRKFIIESLIYWTDFYDFDGFRFDLMGLIDLETMTEIVNELRMYKPDIFIYGEPWTGGLTPIQPINKGMQRKKGFSVFNDDYRDAIKGAVFDQKEKGFIQTKGYNNHDRVIQGILGSINTFASDPFESLNYIEVHDNNTLFDKLYYTLTGHQHFINPEGELLERIKMMHKLAGFILLTSQGVPVLHLGQDFMRSKDGVENSYNSGDRINSIKWERKKEFYDVFIYYKDLIDIRKHNHLFTIPHEPDVRHAIEFRRDIFHSDHSHAIAYTLESHEKYYEGAKKIMVIINPYTTTIKVDLKEHDWKKLLYGNDYFRCGLPGAECHLNIPELSGVILLK